MFFGKFHRSLRCPACGHERWIATSTAIVPWLGLAVGASAVLARRVGPSSHPGWLAAGLIGGCVVVALATLIGTEWLLTRVWRRDGRCPKCRTTMERGSCGFACFGVIPGVHDVLGAVAFLGIVAVGWRLLE